MEHVVKKQIEMKITRIKPTNYKKTVLGYLPVSWNVEKMRDICEKIFVGIATSTTQHVRNKGIPLIRNQNIEENQLKTEELLYITEEFSEMNKSKKIKENDILTVRTGYAGISCVVPKEFEGAQTFTTLVSRPNLKCVDPHYLCYYLNSDIGKAAIEKLLFGNAQKNFNASMMEKLDVIIPPLLEQQKIADILSIWDKAIKLKEKLIEQKKEQKKGLMQRLLTGKVRLPGFEGGWEEVKIKDIGTLKGGSAFPEKYQNLTDGKYPFYKVSDMNNEANNKYMVVASNYIDENICSEIKASVIPSKSIVFAKVGAALLLERKKILSSESCIDNNMMALTVNKNFDYNFVYYLLHTISLSKIANVGALPSLNAKDVYSIKCKIPLDLREQKAIAEFFTLLDREIELLEKELTVIKQQKKGLMQLLLTGKVRVKC